MVQQLRAKPEKSYIPPELREPPLTERKPHETLRKPPVQTLIDRKPPPWADARNHLLAYTRRQQKLGLAPVGIERLFEPGPWDSDPSFWGEVSRDVDGTLDYEIDDG